MALAEKKKPTKQKRGQAKQTEIIQKARKKISSKAEANISPKGAKPSPVVKKPTGFRKGRGFSLSELRGALVSLTQARDLHLPIDIRRSTLNEVNVKAIRDWNIPSRTTKSTKKTPKQSSKKGPKETIKG